MRGLSHPQYEASGQVLPAVGPGGKKSPPIQFLSDYDEVIFLGETNSQLPPMLHKAFALRREIGKTRWKSLRILSIDDLSRNGRPGLTAEALTAERDGAEAEFRKLAAEYCDVMELYRYSYAGYYGSFWTASDGRRRAHVSAIIPGLDIRTTQSSDFVDYPGATQPTVEFYFQRARSILESPETTRIFQYPSA